MTATAAPEATTSEVKARAQKGVLVLAARTLVSQGLRVVSALCLSRLLFPEDYGLFGIVSYAATLGAYMGDLGLSAALVRQAREPTAEETSTLFWGHQVLTGLVALVVSLLAPTLVAGYALGAQALPMVYVMAAGLFFYSLRVIPLMALERQLAFPVIARAELIENLAQVATTIGLAALGCGAWSLAGGGLARGAVGLVCIWMASPVAAPVHLPRLGHPEAAGLRAGVPAAADRRGVRGGLGAAGGGAGAGQGRGGARQLGVGAGLHADDAQRDPQPRGLPGLLPAAG